MITRAFGTFLMACGLAAAGAGSPRPFKNPAAAPGDLWAVYARLRGVPMLVIRGALSDLLSAATVERMRRENPDLEHVEVKIAATRRC